MPVAVASAPALPAQSPLTTLSSHLPELKPVALRCPYADGIEIALDAAGSLHLLARSTSESADDTALAALLVASSWAESHGALLAPALGGRIGERPTLHLFTDRPKKSRRLLETNLRVHLLAPIAIDGRSGWFCTELN
jgi:hypothetical protein